MVTPKCRGHTEGMKGFLPVLALIAVGSALQARAQEDRRVADDLKRFDAEHDQARKEHDLLLLTESYPEIGPALLRVAETTQFPDTRWMAMRGMNNVHFRGCEAFLRHELRSSDIAVRANAARSLGDLGLKAASGDLLSMFVSEHEPGVVEQASLSLRHLQVKAAVPTIRKKLPLFEGQTRVWLLQALGGLGGKGDVPLIAGYLDDPNYAVPDMAAEALGQLAGIDFGPLRVEGSPIPTARTVNARIWWRSHRNAWPHCGDCRFGVVPASSL